MTEKQVPPSDNPFELDPDKLPDWLRERWERGDSKYRPFVMQERLARARQKRARKRARFRIHSISATGLVALAALHSMANNGGYFLLSCVAAAIWLTLAWRRIYADDDVTDETQNQILDDFSIEKESEKRH